MKINKAMTLLLIGCLASTMLVGCNKKSNGNEANKKIENALRKTLGDTDEVKEDATKEESKKDETTEDKEKEKTPSQDNEDVDTSKEAKQTNENTKENTAKTTKNNTKTKENTKEEPIYDEYGYDQYGNYNPNKDLHNDREWTDEDSERWEEIYGTDDVEDYGEDEGNYSDDSSDDSVDTTDDDSEEIHS